MRRWAGHAEVRRGSGVMARIIGAIFGFPKAASQASVTVTLSPEEGAERWTRSFDNMVFSSVQSCGTGLSFETEESGEFCFDVEISAPFVGLIVAYKGTLKPE